MTIHTDPGRRSTLCVVTKNAHIPSLTCSICDTEVVELDDMPWCPTCLLWVVPLDVFVNAA